jgi:hypothetical protein
MRKAVILIHFAHIKIHQLLVFKIQSGKKQRVEDVDR